MLDQRGFTIVELLVSVGILALVTPLLATGMFQILTSTERGRAGFEAQADTRNGAAWMSQDIVMAQVAYLDPDLYRPDYCPVEASAGETFRGTFTWVDKFGDPDIVPEHTVSYCLGEFPDLDPGSGSDFMKSNLKLVRFYDCGDPVIIARNVSSVGFTVIPDVPPADSLVGQEVTIDITAEPARNRFQIRDTKSVQVKMRPVPASTGKEPDACYFE